MLRLRFPDGQCIQYNDANQYERQQDGSYQILKPGENGKRYYVAVILPGTPCIVEYTMPCAVTNPLAREMTPESALNLVTQHLRTLPNHKVAALKQQLRMFNARRKIWRE